MAWESPCFKITGLVAGGDLAAAQYCFVKLSADNTVIRCDAVTDMPVGVLQNAPALGDAAEVMAIGVSKVRVGAGGNIVAGNIIGTDGNGQAGVKAAGADTTHYGIGICIEGADVGHIGSVYINITPNRAA